MRESMLAIIAGAAAATLILSPDLASARGGGGFGGGSVAAGPGWGWRRGWGWGWGAAAIGVGAGLAVSSYYYPNDYYGGYDGYCGYGGDGDCVLQPRFVLTRCGYRQVQVQVCY
jgi:hypothetical protein